MEISQRGLDLIKSFEGLRLTAYKVSSRDKYYTIGYGHYGADVSAGMTITEEQAAAYLREDVKQAEGAVNKYNDIYHFNQNQFDALVSFAYNLGNIDSVTCNGTRPLDKLPEYMGMYIYSGGVKMSGLERRREAEIALFRDPVKDVSWDVEQLARRVIAGEFGNGDDRRAKLGNLYDTVQARVNEYYTTANIVISGAYGNGDRRRTMLAARGYDYETVQKIVNAKMS